MCQVHRAAGVDSAIVDRAADDGRLQHAVLDRRAFFLGLGIRGVEQLIARAYDAAWFWRLDPEVVMARPIERLLESIGQADRIIEESRDGG
ncbi:protein of unknown function [Burkholderia multivorans]